MLRIILILLAIWLVLSLIGLIIEGLLWLFFVGVILLAVTAAWGWFQRSTGSSDTRR